MTYGRRRRSWMRDMAPSPEEIEAAKVAESAGPTGTAWGSGIGSVLGGAAGLGVSALLGAGTAGAGLVSAPELIAAGAGVGGGLGGAAGGAIGGYFADEAEDKVRKAQQVRQEVLEEEQLYQEALDRFLAQS